LNAKPRVLLLLNSDTLTLKKIQFQPAPLLDVRLIQQLKSHHLLKVTVILIPDQLAPPLNAKLELPPLR